MTLKPSKLTEPSELMTLLISRRMQSRATLVLPAPCQERQGVRQARLGHHSTHSGGAKEEVFIRMESSIGQPALNAVECAVASKGVLRPARKFTDRLEGLQAEERGDKGQSGKGVGEGRSVATSLGSKGFALSAGTCTSSNPFRVWRKEPAGSWQRLLAIKWLPPSKPRSARSSTLREPS